MRHCSRAASSWLPAISEKIARIYSFCRTTRGKKPFTLAPVNVSRRVTVYKNPRIPASVGNVLCALVLPIASSGGALAAAHECSGHYSSANESTSNIEVAKDHSIVYWTTRQASASDNSAYNGVGMCNGYAITAPEGKVYMGGACALKNKDGDSWSYTWGMDPGAERGWWKTTAGTGALAAPNSGWWQQTLSDGKTSIGIWGGTCK